MNHHREVPYRLIHCDKDKSVGDPDAGDLLVQGEDPGHQILSTRSNVSDEFPDAALIAFSLNLLIEGKSNLSSI